jgi:alpha-glucosidase
MIKLSRAFIFTSFLASTASLQAVEAKAQPKSSSVIPPSLTTNVVVTSPDGTLSGAIFADNSSGLSYQVSWNGHPVGGPGHIGLRLESANQITPHQIGLRPNFGDISRDQIDEQYPFHGAKATAQNKANILTISVQEANASPYKIEARAYNDGFAWRILLPESASPVQVLEETSTWVLPQGEVWFGERNNSWKLKSYAGEFRHTAVDNLPEISKQGPIQSAPLVVELPRSDGFELVTEANLANYSGMRLRAIGNRKLQVDFTEGSKGFEINGVLTTPWRVTMLCRDLACLANNTLTQNLNPPPDPILFRDKSYIHEGRFVWRYMSRETGTPTQEAEFVDFAAALGYEYTLVDDGWKTWETPWPSMKELVRYARSKNVGVFAWKDSNEISDPSGDFAKARDFLDHAVDAGLEGVKIDFINGESKKQIDFERRVLTLGAERRLMIDFHGLQKPTGEERTFPNAMSREAVRGIELNRMPEGPLPPSHNAALPFTRFAVGPADYTPVNLQWPGATTWSHQLATAILLSSPWLVIAEDPEFLLKNPDAAPALEVFKELPTSWDETIVMDGSQIGGLVGMARRKGSVWFLAIINGSSTSSALPMLPAKINLKSLEGIAVSSPERRSFALTKYTDVAVWDPNQKLQPGDGLVVVLRPRQLVQK